MFMFYIILAMVVVNVAISAEIHVFINGISDGTSVRTLVTIDGQPWMFINKMGDTETAMTKDECNKTKFTITIKDNIVGKITFVSGNGEVGFVQDGNIIKFAEGIGKVSYAGSGTGPGPWPMAYVFKLNDIKFIPRNTAESLILIENRYALEKENKILDNRK